MNNLYLKNLNKKTIFFITVLEYYAEFKKSSTVPILKKWEKSNLIEEIINLYSADYLNQLNSIFKQIENLETCKN